MFRAGSPRSRRVQDCWGRRVLMRPYLHLHRSAARPRRLEAGEAHTLRYVVALRIASFRETGCSLVGRTVGRYRDGRALVDRPGSMIAERFRFDAVGLFAVSGLHDHGPDEFGGRVGVAVRNVQQRSTSLIRVGVAKTCGHLRPARVHTGGRLRDRGAGYPEKNQDQRDGHRVLLSRAETSRRRFPAAFGEHNGEMPPAATMPLPYPETPRVDQIDEYFGTRVADPYRWLEEVDSAQTQRWIAEENDLSESVLGTVPQRQAIRARLTEVWNYERRSVPEKAGKLYAYFRNTGLQNQAVLYVTRDLAEPGRVLLDPNTLSPDGTIALSGSVFSEDGARLAYSVSASGSDWQEWHVRDVASGKDLPDIVRWSKFSGASWKRDGSGFYYSRYEEPASESKFKDTNYNHKVYFHRLGTPQSTDLLVYERPDHKEWNFAALTSEDGRYLVLDVSHGTAPENAICLKDLGADGPVVELVPQGDARYAYLANDGALFYFLTTNEAPRGRIVAIDLRDGALREIVAQSDDPLDGAAFFGDRIVASYLTDAVARVVVYELDGRAVAAVELSGLGSVAGFTGKRTDREVFYSYTSYTEPTSIYRYDVASGLSTRVFTPQIRFDASTFASEQVFYTSKDGTRVPMIVTWKKGTVRDGSAPAILYGYGGFDISVTPAFSSAVLVWLEMGGIYAVAN